MLHAYIDESERDEAFYFLSAIVCTSDQAHELSMKLHRIMARHSRVTPELQLREEFHGSSMMRAAELPWRHIPIRLRLRIYTEALLAIHDSGCQIFIEWMDIAEHKRRKPTSLASTPREIVLGHLLEQISDCGRSASRQRVRVVADEHHTSDVSRSNFSRYQLFGTPGQSSSKLPFIEAPLRFDASHTSRLLQAADLVTYIHNRHTTVHPADPRAVQAQIRLWGIIAPATTPPRGRVRRWP